MELIVEKRIEDRLRYILASAIDMVKFAESKNAALMAVCSALIFGILTIIGQSASLNISIIIYLYIIIVFFALAGVICLVSFIPHLTIHWFLSMHQPSEGNNLFFYRNIADHSPRSLLNLLYDYSGAEFNEIDPIEEDYAEQIIINSQIALNKFRYFNVAIWFTLTGLITPIGVFILYTLWKKQLISSEKVA